MADPTFDDNSSSSSDESEPQVQRDELFVEQPKIETPKKKPVRRIKPDVIEKKKQKKSAAPSDDTLRQLEELLAEKKAKAARKAAKRDAATAAAAATPQTQQVQAVGASDTPTDSKKRRKITDPERLAKLREQLNANRHKAAASRSEKAKFRKLSKDAETWREKREHEKKN